MIVGVVSGMRRETECLVPPGTKVPGILTFAGVGPARAEEGARSLVDDGAGALMSFGVAGGTAPAAGAGVVVLATAVIAGERTIETDIDWRRSLHRLLEARVPVLQGDLAGTDKMLPTPAAKRQLHADTGALACDMESHAVARVATEQGLPFVVVRAISDPHGRNVPGWVLRCLTPEGGVDTGKLLLALARRPWAAPALAGLAGDSKKAFAALRRVAGLPGLGFP